MPLTESERVFIDELLIDLNATRAYRVAFPAASYRSARVNASQLLTKTNIREEITAARAAQQRRTGITADRVIRELARVAFADAWDLSDEAGNRLRHPRDVPFDTRRAVASLKVQRVRTTVTVRTRKGKAKRTTTVEETVVGYKLWDKRAVLERLCRHLGLSAPTVALGELLAVLPADLTARVLDALRSQPERTG